MDCTRIRQEHQDLEPLRDGELVVRLREKAPADRVRGWVPAYTFDLVHAETGEVMGQISLRLGDTEHLRRYAGQIGYGVHPRFRGHRYAARAVRLLLPVARAHGFDALWITCNPENIASRRSCELAGAELIEINDLPSDCDMYAQGDRRKCCYRINL